MLFFQTMDIAMDQDTSSRKSPDAVHLCGKAWTAYIGTVILAALLFFAALPLAFHWNEMAAAGVFAVSILLVGYRVLSIRSVQLYYDDIGVWLYSGILPWTRGISGVKWRDMDEATFTQNFWSWALRSWDIRIGHRFTKASEIQLTSMAHGKEAVGILNGRLQALIRAGSVS
jgi:hypothetical protein